MHSKTSIVLLVLVFLISFSSAQIKVKRKGVKPINVTKTFDKGSEYLPEQLTGKWQEIVRSGRANNVSVDFYDTLFFIFSGDNDVYIRAGKELSMKGKAELEPGNILTTGADEFIIKSLTKTKAVFDDGEKYIHTLIKQQTFWYETLPSDSVSSESFSSAIRANLSDITGNWSVYRRKAKPGAVSASEALIQTLKIKDKNDSTFNGEITFSQLKETQTLPCYITVVQNKIHMVTSKQSWQMNLYKADKDEFIFGSEALMYYAKRY